MNVTPLVDVVLVLLIIFMVITPLLTKQFWLALPEKPDEQTSKATTAITTVVITVTKAGALRINREVVADAEFTERLKRVLAAHNEHTVLFDAHDAAPFDRASQALDLARGAGAANIVVSTVPIVEN